MESFIRVDFNINRVIQRARKKSVAFQMLAKNERKTGAFSVRSGSSSHQQKELKRGGSWKSPGFWSHCHLLPLTLLQPPDPEGCVCILKFSDVLPGRKDSGGSEELHSLQVWPLMQVFNWGSEYASALIFWHVSLGAAFLFLLPSDDLPPSPLLVIFHYLEWMCESNTAPAMPIPTSC